MDVRVRTFPRHGDGLIALKDFQHGDLIFEEDPVIADDIHLEAKTDEFSLDDLGSNIRFAIYEELMHEKKHETFGPKSEEIGNIHRIAPKVFNDSFAQISFPQLMTDLSDKSISTSTTFAKELMNSLLPHSSKRNGGVAHMYEVARKLNHSCKPNAKATFDAATNRLTIEAIDWIAKDEEILISYFDETGTERWRKEQLSFQCPCMKCAEELRFNFNILDFRMKYKKARDEIFAVTDNEAVGLNADNETKKLVEDQGVYLDDPPVNCDINLATAIDTIAAIYTAWAMKGGQQSEEIKTNREKALEMRRKELRVLRILFGDHDARTKQVSGLIEKVEI